MSDSKARIAVIGCGWWAQGWHIPHLLCNDNVIICALVDKVSQPTSDLNPNLVSMDQLQEICGNCPVYTSVEELLQSDAGKEMNGALLCTPHATHYHLAELLIQEGMNRILAQRPLLHILLEKPMTTDVEEAQKLHDLVHSYWRTCSITNNNNNNNVPYFQLNHSANFRQQAKVARDLIQNQAKIGTIRHINASMASPLSWLFGHPKNITWNTPTGNMLGNGFAWGQSSHLLAWIYHVTGDAVMPETVFCQMNHSDTSGADLSHAATIVCQNDITFSLAGTCLLPGNEHGDPPVGKEISVEIYGSEGALFYKGNDHDPASGRLELRTDTTVKVLCDEFHFENTDQEGTGPESLQSFLAACLGRKDYDKGASSLVGLKSIQTLDAMYRSHHSGAAEKIAGTRVIERRATP
ncbi:Oxidoreductase family, NAD-binding Rossmann fold [Seminavis robusta]|uniref:Oxidoreductase family, NAD-binding Rossmann fold n=1 Tax=Seminavis robusta TaxID=568900 RepID=A0A9N8DX44_9STRA|nr:Oxidoreductase family, NAD-binding Rossmann fold [Seminavis robusta]|eukprot:Sro347_g122980.1 Oxidoreductase family, NAD-binding Rossmann fold (409) ;mRNA; r:47370-48596